ncbi:MAG: hypothetical protein WC462_00880 [archaeon]
MNSIDGIIALCVLMAGFALLLGAISGQNNSLKEATDSINSKTTAIGCAAIIDSMFANSAETYEGKNECVIEENKTISKKGITTKSFEIITKARKESISEVETLEHYR